MEVATPFLVKFKESKRDADAIPGYYSDVKDVWVIEDAFNIVPIISCKVLKVRELKTVTKIDGERED